MFMEINDILNGFNGSDCDDKGCNNNNNNHHHNNNNCNSNCGNNTWLILLLLLSGGNGFGGGCGQQMNHGCCNSCCCCEKPRFKKVKQTVYYPEHNVTHRDPGNNMIWLILLLGLCGNNGLNCGSGNSCKC
ncbi:MAG: hypothetical protein ACRC30_10295 [Clostridium sp.]